VVERTSELLKDLDSIYDLGLPALVDAMCTFVLSCCESTPAETDENKVYRMRQQMTNLLFKLKDNLFFYEKNQAFEENLVEPKHLALKIIDFLFTHKLRPSVSEQEEYAKDESSKALKFPSFEMLSESIGMTKDTYNKVLERYSKLGKLNYF